MALTLVANTNTIQAADVNQLIFILQRQTGQTEVGDYYLTEGAYSIGATAGYFVWSLNRNSVPTGVVIDTSLQAASNFNAPGTDNFNANGFHVFALASAINVSCNVGGLYTLSY
jgi:hypothetical protein